MHAFNYHKASSVADATAKFAASNDARLLAGGQTLIAAMKMRLSAPADVIDLGGIAELRTIKVEGGNVTIGAMTTHAAVAASTEVAKAIPALALLAASIGDPMVRNMGTMGGSVANNDPAADYPAALVGLGATVITSKRKIAADQFFTGMYETALEPGEIITAVSFPVPKRAGYMKFKNPASRYAMVGVFVAETTGGMRVAATGAGPSVFRIPDMEKALGKSFSADALKGIKVPSENLNTDIHATAEYRAHLVTVMAARAVEQALGN
jgi:aerobic carbon-monoxide dehydrogenase medium subunit